MRSKSFFSFYNPGNPLYRQRWIQTPFEFQKPTHDDSTGIKQENDASKTKSAQKSGAQKSSGEPGKKRPTQKFYINPFASFFGQQATQFQKKLSELKNFKGPEVIDTEKQPINIEVDLRTVSLRRSLCYDALRKEDSRIASFIKCFHHAAMKIHEKTVMFYLMRKCVILWSP